MTGLIPNAVTVLVRKYQNTVLIVLMLSFLGYAVLQFTENDFDTRSEEARLLRISALNNYDDGNMTAATVITVFLSKSKTKTPNRSHSLFCTDTLMRYGTGRVRYQVLEHKDVKCDKKQHNVDHDASGPCLAVTREKYNNYNNLKCAFPRCRTMVTNDEKCEASGKFDVRGYYSADIPSPVYLPLGMEEGTWMSFQRFQGEADFAPASDRQFAFNAIFSMSTNKDRVDLAKTIARHAADNPLRVFTDISNKWTANVNSPKTTQLSTDDYMEVLLDSVFTLAPAGGNPECYRIFEAVEAGSIPVFLKADLDKEDSRCVRSLHHWYNSPALIVDTWDDLYPTMTALMKNITELDSQQERMGMWYEKYMRNIIADFEDLMLAPLPATDTTDSEDMVLAKVTAAKGKKWKKTKIKGKKTKKTKR